MTAYATMKNAYSSRGECSESGNRAFNSGAFVGYAAMAYLIIFACVLAGGVSVSIFALVGIIVAVLVLVELIIKGRKKHV